MWKWFKKFLIAFFCVLSVFFIYVAFQPADFKISRSIEISAPAEKIFSHVNSAEKLMAWSPWLALDPDAKLNYEGPSEGEGSKVHWKGNENLGEGILEIVESISNQSVSLKLQFLGSTPITNTSDIVLTSEGEVTKVDWSMSGKNNFLGRLAFVMYDMNDLIGKPFETGLQNLKTLSE